MAKETSENEIRELILTLLEKIHRVESLRYIYTVVNRMFLKE